ncbi:MAG: FkbM family methyltransferase [Xanthobacteraceae bacterium]
MKVAVYTIALNEAAHAERWAESARDADYRIVADTGSIDDTVERLTKVGVTVHRIAIRPWRFDLARNTAMALIPADVDVCCSMDMDRFLAPGWRPKLEAAWTSETTALFCWTSYRASANDPTELRGWQAKNFHHRWGYRFGRPVHEALIFNSANEVIATCNDIVMHEVQDRGKPTRAQYLPLMELAYKEDPDDAQICFWLGREYVWANQHDRAVELLQRYLSLPTSTWSDERSEAMRYLARIQPDKKILWLDRARIEAPHRREIWLDLAEELHGKADWPNLLWACINGIEKTHRTGSYLDQNDCWGFRLFDLGATAACHLDLMDRAVEWGKKALELEPNNRLLKNNLDSFMRHRAEVRPAIPPCDITAQGAIFAHQFGGKDILFFVTNPNDEVMKCHKQGIFYEIEELQLITRFLTKGGTFVDIGANVGNHAIYISLFAEFSKTIVFEPNKSAIRILKINLLLNRCDNVDTGFLGVALAAKSGCFSQTTPDPDNLGHTVYFEDADGQVSGFDGDSLLLDEPVKFIKLDTEGMEIEVLSGLEKTIQRWRPTIFVEVWDHRLRSFVDWCENASYQVIEQYRRYNGINNYLIIPMSAVVSAMHNDSIEPERRKLFEAIDRTPDDCGAWLDLALWYRDAGLPVEAAVLFARCAKIGGRTEEAWYAHWQQARSLRDAGDEDGFVKMALEAFRTRPNRAEPLHDLARHYLSKSRGDITIRYADAGLALTLPENDKLGVEEQVYTTGLKEAFYIASSYSQDSAEKDRGRWICNWLALGREVPDPVRGLARHNLRWYAEPATALWPSTEYRPLLVSAREEYKPGNVSIIRDGDGFVALVRSVNYDLLESGFFDTSFRQRIFLLNIDKNFEVFAEAEVLLPEDLPPPRHLDSLGFENARPFIWRNELWSVSCARQLNDEGRAEMVLARIDRLSASQCIFTNWRVLQSDRPMHWEKNWMPLIAGDELRFIYSVDPTRIVSDSGCVLSSETAAIAAENFRGGSHAIPFDNGWLMLIHEWELLGGKRNYLHRFVWLDTHYRVARLSLRFFFKRVASEFAAGLAWHITGEHLVISFGINDHEPTLATVRADEVRSTLMTIDEHQQASELACRAGLSALKEIC